jgi:hypothetical protein
MDIIDSLFADVSSLIEWLGIPGLIVLVVFFILYKKKQQSQNREEDEEDGDDDRIQDADATYEEIIEDVKSFQPSLNPQLRSGFTEKMIQDQLYHYLLERYVTVVKEYAIDSNTQNKIDIDVAHNECGLELKMAEKLHKLTEFTRLKGQIQSYKEHYVDDTFAVVVYGTAQEKLNTNITEAKKFCTSNNIEFLYIVLD